MQFASNAVASKAKSMYSRHLTDVQYDELLKRRSVNDVLTYLKSETAYSDALEDVKTTNIHRGELEQLLNEEAYERAAKLIHYAPKKDLEFYSLGVRTLEIRLILTKVGLLNSESHENYDMDLPSYLAKSASFNIYGLLSIDSYEALCEYLRHTRYYDVLIDHMPDEDGKVDINLLEYDLKRMNYHYSEDVIKKCFKGQKQKDLLTILYTRIELENITKIYRLKRYFNVPKEIIEASLITEFSRIPKKMMDELIEAKDAKEFLKLLAESPYKIYADEKDFVYIEYYASKIVYHLAKRYMRFSTDPACVYYTYTIVHEIEIDNLKHIIEGLRYGEDAERIKAMLIY